MENFGWLDYVVAVLLAADFVGLEYCTYKGWRNWDEGREIDWYIVHWAAVAIACLFGLFVILTGFPMADFCEKHPIIF